jgi:hypothetical protein
MGYMSVDRKRKSSRLSDSEIDDIVESEAEQDDAWAKPVRVRRPRGSASVTLPPALAKRALFVAKLHRARDLEAWLERIITERVQMEESAFVEIKRSLSSPPRTPR